MGIKPIEYVKDSSTAGFAVAGDEKAITKTNANTIQKDVDQGNTEKPDIAQQKFLEANVDYDNLDYTEEEMKNTGKNQIDAEGKDGEDLSEKNGKGVAISSTVIQVASAGVFGPALLAAVLAKKAVMNVCDGFTQAVLAGVVLAGAASAIPAALTFDPNGDDRKNKTGESEQINQTIQQYYDGLGTDMDSMTEESGRYQELVSAQTQADVDTVTQIGALQSEMMVYQSQGNTQKVAELKAQIDNIKKGAEEDGGNREEIANIKGNLEVYAGRSAEAQGVKESGDTVAEFLRDGYAMKTLADINFYCMSACALASAAVLCVPKLAPLFVDGVSSGLAKGMCIAAALLFGTGATLMKKNANFEAEAGDAGSQMASNLGQLGENIEAQSGYTEAAAAGYLELDTKAAETVGKTQQGVDKANQAQAQRQQGTPSTPPPPSDPNPNVGDGTGKGEPEGEDDLVA